jgi:hypothetical protein
MLLYYGTWFRYSSKLACYCYASLSSCRRDLISISLSRRSSMLKLQSTSIFRKSSSSRLLSFLKDYISCLNALISISLSLRSSMLNLQSVSSYSKSTSDCSFSFFYDNIVTTLSIINYSCYC